MMWWPVWIAAVLSSWAVATSLAIAAVLERETRLMTRFDCPQYLDAWKATGAFPSIHHGIFGMIIGAITPEDGAVLDLGSSTGLMSRRLADAGFTVHAIEDSRASIAAGREAGTYEGIDVTRERIYPDTLDQFTLWLRIYEIQVVVARRVFPELDDYGISPAMMSAAFLQAGVQHLFVEGRVPRHNVKHRLHCMHREVEELGEGWAVADFDGPHRAHLIRGADI